ncbi:hypothetical protein MRB53_002111 [Persea americana]|uniref:Uncharacterized protein n=1 Tax=Persea americana TaxID=3435 RepID=A0ACC2MTW9_PERAE|nr:hypothetical protein MRB53_002111 [Persea americana]
MSFVVTRASDPIPWPVEKDRVCNLHVEHVLLLINYWASVVGVMEGMADELLVVHVIQWEALTSHFKLVELNRTIVIAEWQLTEAWEVLRRLCVRRQDRDDYAVRLAATEDREREMSDQMDGLLRCADKLCRSTSRGVPLGPLVKADVDAAIG